MHCLMQYFFPAFCRHRLRTLFVVVSIAFSVFGSSALYGQARDRITGNVNAAELVTLPNHHPQWANKENAAGLLPSGLTLEQLTLVLSRSPEQEENLQEFLAEQQELTSPNYHHWLTPAEMGERFGLSEHDIAALTLWLQSQGLHVNWVSPSRTFIGFGGTAGSIGRAFHTELGAYHANGAQRVSPSSDPMVPRALAPAIKAVHGLYTVEDQPLHSFRVMQSVSPDVSTSSGEHFITPGDFATIYGGGSTSGVTIGIVGRSRTDFSDFENFRQQTETNFPNPTEIVPTAFGGVDPGPAYTAPPATNVSLDDQSEATLDVMRAGSVAGNAQILLVVATAASGGVEADAQYLVEMSPAPASVMSISFGACEASAGAAGVAFWDTLFQQAAAEGISVLVSSGDSGASGCDQAFTTPPASPMANSPNYICSSSYATCVGGTEFNDTSNPSQYWSGNDGRNLASALSYIPEGGWNEPLNSTGGAQVAASGGGVSRVIATPAWQTGSGVPAARSGRYTPDIAFSASSHDGYFGCFAAGGGDCVAASSDSFSFAVFAGTSAAAPSMAGIAALLDGETQAAQGNLNPQLYQMAAAAPTVFHDVTVASSGATNCNLATPSLCNNSIAGPKGLSGGKAGYEVTAGYDQVTGLGSLNIENFLESFQGPPAIKILTNPPSLTFPSQLVGFPSPGEVDFQNSGSAPLDPLAIAITGANASDFSPVNNCQSPLAPAATCSVQITFTPSAAGTRTATMAVTSANAANSPRVVSLSGTGTTTLYTPQMAVSGSANSITIAQSLTVMVVFGTPPGAPKAPTGSVTLTSSSYHSAPVTLSGTFVTIDIPAGTLPLGNDVLTGNYTPDSASASIYSSASATTLVSVTPVPIPSFEMSGGVPMQFPPGATTGNTSSVGITPTGGFTGAITLSAAVTSAPPGAQHLPTFSFGTTSPVSVTGITSVSATLTVLTTAASSKASRRPGNRISWYTAGAASLACLLLLSTPRRLRRWRAVLGSLLLLISLSGGMLSCGGGGSGNNAGAGTTTTGDPGTTAGQYTVTVTGTAPGATSATCTIGVNID
jgi:Pro-kumamolisin, activation domain